MLEIFKRKVDAIQLNKKFNHEILASWFPTLNLKQIEKLFGTSLKSLRLRKLLDSALAY